MEMELFILYEMVDFFFFGGSFQFFKDCIELGAPLSITGLTNGDCQYNLSGTGYCLWKAKSAVGYGTHMLIIMAFCLFGLFS